MNDFEKPQNNGEEIREIDGKKYRRVETGYTIRGFFSHEGLGWDTRWSVLRQYEVKNPRELPDEPYYRWEVVEDENLIHIPDGEMLSIEQNKAYVYVAEIKDKVAQRGSNDREIGAYNELLKDLMEGKISPEDARRIAYQIQDGKMDYR